MERRSRKSGSAILVLVLVAIVAFPTADTMAQNQAQLSRSQLKSEIKLAPKGAPATSDSGGRLSSNSASRRGDDDDDDDDSGLGPNVQVSKNQNSTDCVRSGASETTVAGEGDKLVIGFNDAEGFGGPPFLRGPCNTTQAGVSGFAFSENGGRSWTDAGAPPRGSRIGFGPGKQGCSDSGRYVTRGDPWLDVDGDGTFVYTNLGQWDDNGELPESRCASGGTVPPAGVTVHFGGFSGRGKDDDRAARSDERAGDDRDEDDGRKKAAFAWNRAVLLQSPNYPRDFLDKEALSVGGESKGADIFVTVTNFIEVCNIPFFAFGQIELYRSLNAGTTWNRIIVQPDETFITNPANPNCGLDGVINQGSTSAVGPSGQLYVAWERGWFAPAVGGAALPRATIAFKKSLNHGSTFGPLRTVRSICSGTVNPPAGYNRTSSNDFPRIAVARRGFFRGRIYISYHDCSARQGAAPFGEDTDAYVIYSDDEGTTWSDPEPLHPTADGKIQFWPVVTVNSRGEVSVLYYESREVNVTPDPTDDECVVRIAGPLDNPTLKRRKVSSLVDVMLVRSRDGGQSFSAPQRLTTRTTNWCRATPINSIIPNFGDYNDLRSVGSQFLATWADGRNRRRNDHIPTVFFSKGR